MIFILKNTNIVIIQGGREMDLKDEVINNIEFDSKILSSSHINFLFGAGVNGKAFPQMSGFSESVSFLEKELNRKMSDFEIDIEELSKSKIEKLYKIFKAEFSKHLESVDYNHPSVFDIENLFRSVNKIILNAENRTLTTKQVNIYTLNYDDLVERVLHKIGVLNNVVSSSNIDNHDKFFDLVGFNYNLNRYIPTYLVSKIHGDIINPILPGRMKYDETLLAKRFEIIFKMKSQLSRLNSLLFVIGYSGKDKHINRLIKDCLTNGLSIYWFRYSEFEELPIELKDKVILIDQEIKGASENSTLICSRKLEEIWREQLVE